MLFCTIPFADAAGNGHKNNAKRYLKHATTYYWLGIADKGDPGAFQTSLDYIDKARVSLSYIDNKDADDHVRREIEALEKQLNLLRLDVNEQLAIAYVRFFKKQ